MPSPIEEALRRWLAEGCVAIGQIAIRSQENGFLLYHREDGFREDLETHSGAEAALALAKFDDAGKYRPLKTAPNLRRGWRLRLSGVSDLQKALDHFYPGRLAVLLAFENKSLTTTALRDTLARQTGIFRVTEKLTEDEAEILIGRFCRSNGGEPGCLRTILWARDNFGARPSTQLPPQKFETGFDQTGRGETVIPLICQEACNLLVAEAREVVKAGAAPVENT